MNNVYLVTRQKDNVLVSVMRNKLDGTYSFVNLTKGHICPCRFDSIEDAIKDMEEKKDNGEIIDFINMEARI
jgi:hypothetical protein|nr:MAG TPA: hypothetical protein [Caudoviricetes sp.]